jgi:hypothetical protein
MSAETQTNRGGQVVDSEVFAASTTTESIPKPYSAIWHPYMTWKDVATNYLVSFLLNVSSLNKFDPTSTEASDTLSKIRKKCDDMSNGFLRRTALKKWSDSSQCKVAEYIGEIPFQMNILKDWNIADTADILPSSASGRDAVKVLVMFPSSLLTAEERESATTSESSKCLVVKHLDLKNFALDVPVIIQFHGGGLVSTVDVYCHRMMDP